MKICRVCGTEKKMDDFSRNKDKKDGRLNICKVCERARMKIYYKRNREKIIDKNKKWIANNRERHNEIAYEWLVRNNMIKKPGSAKKRRIDEQGKGV